MPRRGPRTVPVASSTPPVALAWLRRLENVLVVALVVILIAIAARRIDELRAAAEAVAVARVTAAVRAGLGNALIQAAVRGGPSRLRTLLDRNPFRFLLVRPARYAGSFVRLPHRLRPGWWYYDRGRHLLVYAVRARAHFVTPLPPPARIEWRLVPVYDGRPHDTEHLAGIALKSVAPYRWRGVARRVAGVHGRR